MRISSVVRRAAQVNADALASEYLDRRQTWREFEDKVGRFAGGLRHLGIEDGDRVAMLALNSDRCPSDFLLRC
jgi:long-chain acyl-CoA synthetase